MIPVGLSCSKRHDSGVSFGPQCLQRRSKRQRQFSSKHRYSWNPVSQLSSVLIAAPGSVPLIFYLFCRLPILPLPKIQHPIGFGFSTSQKIHLSSNLSPTNPKSSNCLLIQPPKFQNIVLDVTLSSVGSFTVCALISPFLLQKHLFWPLIFSKFIRLCCLQFVKIDLDCKNIVNVDLNYRLSRQLLSRLLSSWRG